MNYTISDLYSDYRGRINQVAGTGGLSRPVSMIGILDYELVREAREYIALSQSALPEEAPRAAFQTGARVLHPIMGPGTVVGVDDARGAHIVQFDGAATPRAISFKAKLARIGDE